VLLSEGEIRIACVDRSSFRPRRIPPPILDRLSP
jgi:acyl-CoA thioesterase FadM